MRFFCLSALGEEYSRTQCWKGSTLSHICEVLCGLCPHSISASSMLHPACMCPLISPFIQGSSHRDPLSSSLTGPSLPSTTPFPQTKVGKCRGVQAAACGRWAENSPRDVRRWVASVFSHGKRFVERVAHSFVQFSPRVSSGHLSFLRLQRQEAGAQTTSNLLKNVAMKPFRFHFGKQTTWVPQRSSKDAESHPLCYACCKLYK